MTQLLGQFAAEPVVEQLELFQAGLAHALAQQRGVQVAEQRLQMLFVAGKHCLVGLACARRLRQGLGQRLDFNELTDITFDRGCQFHACLRGDVLQAQVLVQYGKLGAQRAPMLLQVDGRAQPRQGFIHTGFTLGFEEVVQALAPEQVQRADACEPGACRHDLGAIAFQAAQRFAVDKAQGGRQCWLVMACGQLVELLLQLPQFAQHRLATRLRLAVLAAEQWQPAGQTQPLFRAQAKQGRHVAGHPRSVRRRVVDLEAGRVRLQGSLALLFGLAESLQAVGECQQGGAVCGKGLQLSQGAAFVAGR
ncbi:hypothetical protein D3C78_1114580 [compost metagenome]